MVITKRFVLRLFLSIEIIGGIFFFIFGPYGMLAVSKKVQEQKLLAAEIEHQKKEVACLQQQIDVYATTDFYKEKIAREDLQMARPEEEVYILE